MFFFCFPQRIVILKLISLSLCLNNLTNECMKYLELERMLKKIGCYEDGEIMETVKAFIERGKDGTYGVYVDLEDDTLNYGIHGTGNSAKDAVDDFMSSYEAMKEFYHQRNKFFVEANFIFQYDVASFLQYYSDKFTLVGLQNITGINQRQLGHYVNGHRKPGIKTVKKIEKSLHHFAKDLSQVQFV